MNRTTCPHCDCGELYYEDNWGFYSWGEPYQGMEFVVCSNGCLNGREGFSVFLEPPQCTPKKEESYTCPVCEIRPVRLYSTFCEDCGDVGGSVEVFDFSNRLIDSPF